MRWKQREIFESSHLFTNFVASPLFLAILVMYIFPKKFVSRVFLSILNDCHIYSLYYVSAFSHMSRLWGHFIGAFLYTF